MRPVIVRRPDSANVVQLARVTTELGDACGAARAAQIDIQVVVRPLDVQEASGRSISVAWSHDEPHDESDNEEEQHAHSKPSERTHSVSKATHHGEVLLHLPGSSRTPPVSRPGAVFAARNYPPASRLEVNCGRTQAVSQGIRLRNTPLAKLAYLAHNVGMSTDLTELSVSQARDHFSDAVNRAAFGGEITYVTRGRNQQRAAAIVPAELVEQYEAMIDLEDGRIALERLADLEAGRTAAVPADEAARALGL